MRNNLHFRFIVGWFIFILFLNVVEVIFNALALGFSPLNNRVLRQDFIKESADTVFHFVTFFDTVTMQAVIYAVAKNANMRRRVQTSKKKKVLLKEELQTIDEQNEIDSSVDTKQLYDILKNSRAEAKIEDGFDNGNLT